MANLYGILESDRSTGNPTRLATEHISSYLEDWNGRVTTTVTKLGDVVVRIGDKGGGNSTVVFEGNIYDQLKGKS